LVATPTYLTAFARAHHRSQRARRRHGPAGSLCPLVGLKSCNDRALEAREVWARGAPCNEPYSCPNPWSPKLSCMLSRTAVSNVCASVHAHRASSLRSDGCVEATATVALRCGDAHPGRGRRAVGRRWRRVEPPPLSGTCGARSPPHGAFSLPSPCADGSALTGAHARWGVEGGTATVPVLIAHHLCDTKRGPRPRGTLASPSHSLLRRGTPRRRRGHVSPHTPYRRRESQCCGPNRDSGYMLHSSD